MSKKKPNGVERAVERIGGRRAMAELADVTRQAVEKWIAAGEIPPKKVKTISKATGVPAQELNPAVFGA